MIILGIHGGMDLQHEVDFGSYAKDTHDSAAVLIVDGQIVAAAEQERFDRIKHSNKFPVEAIQFCLDTAGVTLGDVDKIAVVNREETHAWFTILVHFTQRYRKQFQPHDDWILNQMETAFGHRPEPEKLMFVGHHLSHAMSGFAWSGFERALVVTLDGAGDDESGTISIGVQGDTLRTIRSFPVDQSLGVFYQRLAFFLGFRAFSEFKVMGLAPYGEPAVFRRFFEPAYSIQPDGGYKVDFSKLYPLMKVVPPRKPSDPIEQVHKDIAASMQEMLEKVVFAMFRNLRNLTGEKNLVLSGGVAHNCALNGKLAYSDLFDRIYVQPAAHDGGTALGAAQYVAVILGEPLTETPSHVFFGREEPVDVAESALARWGDHLQLSDRLEEEALANEAADFLAAGKVIGVCLGASEFGPRALGHRSILADPRSEKMKDIVNAMVKKREGFRPFAPVVPAADFDTYFERPNTDVNLSFMSYAVRVKPDHRSALGAITHVDGTARVQVLDDIPENTRLLQLIDAFRIKTGLPMLLNTSFNNHAEPIVDTVEDSIRCFLSTGLDALVVSDRIVTKKDVNSDAYAALVPSLPFYVCLSEISRSIDGARENLHVLAKQSSMPATWDAEEWEVSEQLYHCLLKANDVATLDEIVRDLQIAESDREALAEELFSLWSDRLVRLRAP